MNEIYKIFIEGLQKVAKSLGEYIVKVTSEIDWSKTLEPIATFFEKAIEFKEVLEKIVPICQQKMYESGWVPFLPPSAGLVEFVAKLATDEITSDNIDEFVFEQLGNNPEYFGSILNTLKRYSFENGVNKTIEEILYAYKDEKFCLTIMSSMPIIERLVSGERYVNYENIKKEQIELMSELMDTELGSDFIKNKLFKGLHSCNEVTDDLIVNRHAISHGFDFNFDKKKALNCIILIDYFLNVDTNYLLSKKN